MIRFDYVSCSYEKGRKVLDDVSFTIGDGESVGLIGANGAGKSTLMKVLLGLQDAEGEVWVDDLPVKKENLREIRRKLGFVLQNSDNQMFMPTVYEDILFAPLNYGLSRQEAEARCDAVLARLGLTELKHRHNHKISGGEKRMAAIATVLAMEPEVLLMDEPTSALDPISTSKIEELAMQLKEQYTIVIVTHNMQQAVRISDRTAFFLLGELVECDDTQQLFSQPQDQRTEDYITGRFG